MSKISYAMAYFANFTFIIFETYRLRKYSRWVSQTSIHNFALWLKILKIFKIRKLRRFQNYGVLFDVKTALCDQSQTFFTILLKIYNYGLCNKIRRFFVSLLLKSKLSATDLQPKYNYVLTPSWLFNTRSITLMKFKISSLCEVIKEDEISQAFMHAYGRIWQTEIKLVFRFT